VVARDELQQALELLIAKGLVTRQELAHDTYVYSAAAPLDKPQEDEWQP
jgi:hypothetical protein